MLLEDYHEYYEKSQLHFKKFAAYFYSLSKYKGIHKTAELLKIFYFKDNSTKFRKLCLVLKLRQFPNFLYKFFKILKKYYCTSYSDKPPSWSSFFSLYVFNKFRQIKLQKNI